MPPSWCARAGWTRALQNLVPRATERHGPKPDPPPCAGIACPVPRTVARGGVNLTANEAQMIDVAALGSLFVEIFGASKEWTEPKIARFDPVDKANKEPIVRDLMV